MTTTPQQEPSHRSDQPDSFFWGVATSAYQSEGGLNGPGEPQTNWASAEEKKSVSRLGSASRFWDHYQEDFQRCRDMGLNAFRMGLCWSKIQPTYGREATAPPPFDESCIEKYAEIIASCRIHGMEPVITLHHFVHPAWLPINTWLNADTVAHYKHYVTYTVTRLNEILIRQHQQKPLHWFITINEPNMLVLNTFLGIQFPSRARPGFANSVRAYNHLLAAHIEAYNAIHDLYALRQWKQPMITFNNYCSDLYWSDKALIDIMHMRENGLSPKELNQTLTRKSRELIAALNSSGIVMRHDLPYYFGCLMRFFTNLSIGGHFQKKANFSFLLNTLYQSPRACVMDFIGLDYYDPFVAHVFRLPKFFDHEIKSRSFRAWIMNTITSKWWDWRVLPQGLHFFCSYYAKEYGKPVLIAENGMAIQRTPENQLKRRKDRMTRSQFIKLHLREVQRIREDNVPLLGYLHWSLFDNYEWGTYTPRFGLYSVDFTNPQCPRQATDLEGDCPSETYKSLIKEYRQTQSHATRIPQSNASTPPLSAKLPE